MVTITKVAKGALILFMILVTLVGATATDFTINSKKPVMTNITLSGSNVYEFKVTLNTTAPDINCTWYLEDEQINTGTGISLVTSGQVEANGYDMRVNCTSNTTNTSKAWIVNIEKSQYSEIILLIVWVICGLVTYVGLYKRGEQLIASVTWTALAVLSYFFVDNIIGTILAIISVIILVLEITRLLNKKAISRR